MSFVAGLLRGFNTASQRGREEARAEQDKQDAKEEKILGILAQSDDAEVSNAAITASLQRASGVKPPKGGFLASLMGPQTQVHPAVASLLKLVNTPHSETFAGPPVAEGPMRFATPPPAAAPAPPKQPGFGPHDEGGPEMPAPPQAAPPGSAAMAPPPTPGSITAAPGAPAGGNALVGAPPPASIPVGGGPPLAQPNRPISQMTVTTPRKLFLSTTERAMAAAHAKTMGDLSADRDALRSLHTPESVIEETLRRKIGGRSGAMTRDSYAEGEIIRKPDGSWAQILYNKYDPTDQIEIPATDPALKSIAATGTDAQLAHELFGKNYPGMMPNQVLASLDNVQRKALDVIKRQRAAMTAGATTRATGDEQIKTAENMPIGVPNAIATNTSAMTTPADLAGQRLGKQLDDVQIGKLTKTKSAISMIDQLSKALVDPTGAGATGFRQQLATYAPNWATQTYGWGADEKSQNAVIKLGKQIIGKALEEGVLRKEDEQKYTDILPTIGDAPEVAGRKIEMLRERLNADLQIYLDGLAQAGYRTGPPPTLPGGPPPAPGAADGKVHWDLVNGQLVKRGGG